MAEFCLRYMCKVDTWWKWHKANCWCVKIVWTRIHLFLLPRCCLLAVPCSDSLPDSLRFLRWCPPPPIAPAPPAAPPTLLFHDTPLTSLSLSELAPPPPPPLRPPRFLQNISPHFNYLAHSRNRANFKRDPVWQQAKFITRHHWWVCSLSLCKYCAWTSWKNKWLTTVHLYWKALQIFPLPYPWEKALVQVDYVLCYSFILYDT